MYQIKATVTKNWQAPTKIELFSKRAITEAQLKSKFINDKTMFGTNDTVKNKIIVNDFECVKIIKKIKLMPHEIEKERLKFIDYHCKDLSSEIAYRFNHKLKKFNDPLIDEKYQSWLSRKVA